MSSPSILLVALSLAAAPTSSVRTATATDARLIPGEALPPLPTPGQRPDAPVTPARRAVDKPPVDLDHGGGYGELERTPPSGLSEGQTAIETRYPQRLVDAPPTLPTGIARFSLGTSARDLPLGEARIAHLIAAQLGLSDRVEIGFDLGADYAPSSAQSARTDRLAVGLGPTVLVGLGDMRRGGLVGASFGYLVMPGDLGGGASTRPGLSFVEVSVLAGAHQQLWEELRVGLEGRVAHLFAVSVNPSEDYDFSARGTAYVAVQLMDALVFRPAIDVGAEESAYFPVPGSAASKLRSRLRLEGILTFAVDALPRAHLLVEFGDLARSGSGLDGWRVELRAELFQGFWAKNVPVVID